MTENDLLRRTKKFALAVMQLVSTLPNNAQGRAIGNQLIRSGTSVGANYRAACKGRSRAGFIAKLGIVEEEADESQYWIELIIEGRLLPTAAVAAVHQEARELTAIMAASKKSAKVNASHLQIANRKSQISG